MAGTAISSSSKWTLKLAVSYLRAPWACLSRKNYKFEIFVTGMGQKGSYFKPQPQSLVDNKWNIYFSGLKCVKLNTNH